MIEIQIHKKLLSSGDAFALSFDALLEPGRFYTLYGASGAGKTTILRMLAGLISPDSGKISVGNTTWFDREKNINLKPQQRKIGFVFQDYALFPNMTVRENLTFALQKGQNRQIVEELIDVAGLENLQHRKPGTLSGGQQQRVALARALVQQPDILLLDEPLSALDAETRAKLQDYIQHLHRRFSLTTLLVSHDIGEIVKLSDYVFEIQTGRIIRQGTPQELFVEKHLSGKFQFVGEILQIEPQDTVWIITVLIQNHLVKVIAQKNEAESLCVGDKVVVAAKAFSTVIYKI